MENEYYILPKNRINTFEHSDIVENINTVRWSLDGNYFLCKTRIGLKNLGFLTPFTPYSHEEILIELQKPMWTNQNEI